MQTNIYSIYFILTLLTKSKGFFSVLSAVFNPLFAQWPAGLSLRPHSHKQRTSSVNKAQRPFYGAAPPPPPLTRNAEILARKFLQLPSALAFHSSISIQLPPRAIAFAIEFALVLLEHWHLLQEMPSQTQRTGASEKARGWGACVGRGAHYIGVPKFP